MDGSGSRPRPWSPQVSVPIARRIITVTKRYHLPLSRYGPTTMSGPTPLQVIPQPIKGPHVTEGVWGADRMLAGLIVELLSQAPVRRRFNPS